MKSLFQSILAVVIAFGLSAYFILPLIYNIKSDIYLLTDSQFHNTLAWSDGSNFFNQSIRFFDIFFTTPREMLSETAHATIPSFTYILITLVALFVWLFKVEKKKKKQRLPIIITLFSLIGITDALNSVEFGPLIGRYIPKVFYSVQYPGRFFLVSSLFMVVLFGILVADISVSRNSGFVKSNIIKPVTFCGVCIMLLMNSYVALSHGAFDPRNVLTDNTDSTKHINYITQVAIGEYLPKKLISGHTDYDKVIEQYTQNNDGYAATREIYDYIEKRGTKILPIEGGQAFEFPKIYYPGYKAYTVDDTGKRHYLGVKESPNGLVEVFSAPENGQLQILDPAKIHLYFGWSKATQLGVGVTVITILALIIYAVKLRTTKKVVD
ncbi:MAG: hypothetical protein LBI63_05650 [Candidatus Ancillula sp.]|nr:hypothetical protein [Candidatus Ancillula sp.]